MERKQNVKVSVIIVNYHTSGMVADCIASLRQHTAGVSYEVLVVDNHSEPDLEAILRQRCGLEGVRCVMLDDNVGFGRANNEGFRHAQGQHILCLNPDTLLTSDALTILSRHLDSHPRVGAVGGNLVDAEGRPAFSYSRILPGLWWELCDLSGQYLQRLVYGRSWVYCHESEPLQVAYITGADLMLRREVWEATAGFSPLFFMYFEETDLCARIRRQGWRVECVPAACIVHLEGASFGPEDSVSQRRYDMIERSRRLYMRRHLSYPSRLLCHFLHLVTILFYLLLFRILRRPFYRVWSARLRALFRA